MDSLQVVSRKDVFEENKPIEEDQVDLSYVRNAFEYVEVSNGDNSTEPAEKENEKEEFEFPLFSGILDVAPGTEAKEDNAAPEERGRAPIRLMKVSLREPSVEKIDQSRPKSYYFSTYTEEELHQFQESAISYDRIFSELSLPVTFPRYRGKVIDLTAHDNSIAAAILRERQLKKRRPGKKQRLAKKLGAEREKQRELKAQEIRKLIKKRFHKRGGKKNKKKAAKKPLLATPLKPKFRTE